MDFIIEALMWFVGVGAIIVAFSSLIALVVWLLRMMLLALLR